MNATRQNKSRKAKARTPYCEIVIERRPSNNPYERDVWGILTGSHWTPICDSDSAHFYDPMLASKYISATTQGHVRVLWNL